MGSILKSSEPCVCVCSGGWGGKEVGVLVLSPCLLYSGENGPPYTTRPVPVGYPPDAIAPAPHQSLASGSRAHPCRRLGWLGLRPTLPCAHPPEGQTEILKDPKQLQDFDASLSYNSNQSIFSRFKLIYMLVWKYHMFWSQSSRSLNWSWTPLSSACSMWPSFVCAFSICLVFLLDNLIPLTLLICQDICKSKGENKKTKWALRGKRATPVLWGAWPEHIWDAWAVRALLLQVQAREGGSFWSN